MKPIQEMFDTVVKHLAAQGKKSIMQDFRDPSTGNTITSCMYRGPEGTKCAAGVLISDEDYKPEYEGRRAVSLSCFDGHCRWHPQGENFLGAIQNIHDNSDVQRWPRLFENLCQEYGLDPAVLKALVWNDFTAGPPPRRG